jgi:DDE_Tnp_1-associated/Transposase DDE domain
VTAVPAGNLLAYLAQVPDPRGRQGRRHPLAAMLAAVVCAMLCGARGYSAIVQWLHALPVSWWHRLGFTRRPPKDHAFRELLAAISPEAFEAVIRAWVSTALGEAIPEDELRAVALDGKTLRGTLTPHQRAVHLLSLFDQRLGCVLSQQRVDEKTNEHKAALELLKTIVLKDCVVTGDAMFCQREICQQILDSGGDYFVVVKDNQPSLQETIAAEFRAAFSPGERTSA